MDKFELRDIAGQSEKTELLVGINGDNSSRISTACTDEELYQLYIPLREKFKDSE